MMITKDVHRNRNPVEGFLPRLVLGYACYVAATAVLLA
jgi:hypothetical protein